MRHTRSEAQTISIPDLRRRQFLAGAGASLIGIAAGVRPARAETIVLRVGDQKGGVEATLRVAGLLDHVPYKLEFSQFPAAAPLLEALNADAVDLAWAGDAPVTFALANGVPAKIVSAHRSNGAGTALLVKQDSPIRTIADLKGKTIGTGRGSIGHALVISGLKRAGLTASDVKFAFLQPPEAKLALEGGDVDAWSTWGVYVPTGLRVNKYREVFDGENGILSGLGYLVARDNAIEPKRAAILDFVGRAARARDWATAHVDDYARYLSTLISVPFDIARDTHLRNLTKAEPIAAKVIADQQATADLYSAAGIITKHVDFARFFDESFNSALSG
jgi:sulfonate transport system substrate-binding protein